MLVSWNWLKDYVTLDMPPDELELRLAMSGLNHEGTKRAGDDLVIDLEVTSNRPDCLGHVGVAREIAVLYDRPLSVPPVELAESDPSAGAMAGVTIECPELCSRYIARVIRGVKIGPSPAWLVDRLAAIGLATINNVVDVSNYVLMECGQPLHVFDLRLLAGPEIIVRRARPGELFEAIDHRTYELTDGMCVIGDAERSVALGGVMGGADSEVSDTSVDLLIEAARFDPLSIRTTARKLNLHSPSSYRFERGVDPLGVDWASRRCCQLILELAGGTLATGSVDVPGPPKLDGEPIVLRLSQLRRVLGIEIEPAEVRRILTALGLGITTDDKTSLSTRPPSWRRDLTREVDLIEEVGRIHGYENVPEDVAVPMAASHRRDEDRVMGKVRTVMTAAGLDEAMTVSVVSQTWCDSVSPWSDAAPIRSSTPMLRGANLLRRSLIPSLLGARQVNQSLGNTTIELFETAKIYLPRPEQLPEEPWMLGIVSGENFLSVKGVLESVVAALNPAAEVTVDDAQVDLLEAGATCRLSLNGRLWGYLGQVGPEGLKQFGLRGAATVAEVRIDVLAAAAKLVPAHQPTSPFPAIAQDLNLIVDESLRWSDLAATVRAAAGEHLEQVDYRETYRDAQHDGAGKKRLMFSFTLRSQQRTLTGEQAEQIRTQIVAACAESHAAVLVG